MSRKSGNRFSEKDMRKRNLLCRNVERPVMDFTLSPEIEDIRVRTRSFVEEHVLPLEADPASYDDHENIRLDVLRTVQAKARAEGLWAPQAPKEYGGMGLPVVAWAAMYEEANRSIFGPLAFNCAAPDDGNMNLLARVGTPAQKDKWLKPIVEGSVRSSFVMTEPAPALQVRKNPGSRNRHTRIDEQKTRFRKMRQRTDTLATSFQPRCATVDAHRNIGT